MNKRDELVQVHKNLKWFRFFGNEQLEQHNEFVVPRFLITDALRALERLEHILRSTPYD